MMSHIVRRLFVQNIHAWLYTMTGCLLLVWSTISVAGPVVVTGTLLDVKVDVEACGAGYTFCDEASPSGINEGVAAVGNHSPVLLVIQIISPKNQPVTGLTESDFSVSHIISPSGSGVVKPDPLVCPSCFSDEGNGVYRLAVQRNITGNPWLAGTYFVHLEVQVTPTSSVFAVVPIKIQ